MPLKYNSSVFFPTRCEVSQRGQEFLYIAADELSVVKVGPAGAKVLEASRLNEKVEDIIKSRAKQLKKPFDVIAPSILKFLERMVSAGFLNIAPINQRLIQKYVEPVPFNLIMLYFHLTDDCNQSCIYCYNANHRRSAKEPTPLSYHEWELLLEQAANAGVRQIIFTGGEPLLSPFWQRLAEKVHEHEMALILLTNGTLIDKNNADFIARLFTQVIVSLDSPDERINNKLRGPNTFKKAIRGIHALVERNYGGLFIRPVVTKINLPSIRDFPFFGRDCLGCTQFLITLYIPNSMQEIEQLDLLPNFEEYQNVMKDFNDALKEVKGNSQISCDLPEMTIRCGAGSSILSIGANGDVFPCQSLHNDAMRLGNIREKDLLEIGNSSPFAAYFRKLNVFSVETCRECNLNVVCGGGCRAVAWNLRGRLEAYTPILCDFNRDIVWQKLWAMAKR